MSPVEGFVKVEVVDTDFVGCDGVLEGVGFGDQAEAELGGGQNDRGILTVLSCVAGQ